MWMHLFWLVCADASSPAPSPPWGEVVARLSSPVKGRWTPEERQPALDAWCDAGQAAACRIALGEPPRPVFTDACAHGDLAACLGAAHLSEASSPHEAFTTYRSLCDGGHQDACADVARAHASGIGVYASRVRARRIAEPLCDSGEGLACVVLADLDRSTRPAAAHRNYTRAMHQEVAGAAWGIALLATPEDRERAMQAACAMGSGIACWTLVLDGEASDEALIPHATRACGLGLGEGCVADVAWGLAGQRLTRAQARARLHALCRDDVDAACTGEAYLAYGGDLQPVHRGRFEHGTEIRFVERFVPYLKDCYRDQLDRSPRARGAATLVASVSWRGQLVAVAPRTEGDIDFDRCLAEALTGSWVPRPIGGAARLEVSIDLRHEARVDVQPLRHDDSMPVVGALERTLLGELGLDLDDCYLSLGGSSWDHQFVIVHGTLERDGRYVPEAMVEGSGDAATDQCVLATLREARPKAASTLFAFPASVRIDFNHILRAPRRGAARFEGAGVERIPIDASLNRSAQSM